MCVQWNENMELNTTKIDFVGRARSTGKAQPEAFLPALEILCHIGA